MGEVVPEKRSCVRRPGCKKAWSSEELDALCLTSTDPSVCGMPQWEFYKPLFWKPGEWIRGGQDWMQRPVWEPLQ